MFLNIALQGATLWFWDVWKTADSNFLHIEYLFFSWFGVKNIILKFCANL